MKNVLIIQRWLSTHQMYADLYSGVVSENEIIYPDQMGSANKLLTYSNCSFSLTSGVLFPDGWTYYKSAAVPTVTAPSVVLPTNVEVLPPTVTVPGDYHIRCRIEEQF